MGRPARYHLIYPQGITLQEPALSIGHLPDRPQRRVKPAGRQGLIQLGNLEGRQGKGAEQHGRKGVDRAPYAELALARPELPPEVAEELSDVVTRSRE